MLLSTGSSDSKLIASFITKHFAEVKINVLVHWESQPVLHTEFKDTIQEYQNV